MAARVWSSLKTGETENRTSESGVFVYRTRFSRLPVFGHVLRRVNGPRKYRPKHEQAVKDCVVSKGDVFSTIHVYVLQFVSV